MDKPRNEDTRTEAAETRTTLKQEAGRTRIEITPTEDASSKVKLLSPGKGEKQKLTYNFLPQRQRKLSVKVEVVPKRESGAPGPSAPPPIELTMTGSAQTLSFSGNRATREYTFANIVPSVKGAPPQLLQGMVSHFRDIRDFKVRETVSDRGEVLSLESDMNRVSPQIQPLVQYLSDALSGAWLPLPDEPVGLGAKWVATSTVKSAGQPVTQESTVELVAMDDDRVTVEVQYRQSMPGRKLDMPGIPAGVSVDLVKLEGSGTGKLSIDLAELTSTSVADQSVRVETRITQPGLPSPITESIVTRMRSDIRITP